VALGSVELAGLSEVTGLEKGATELLVGGVALTDDDGSGLAVGEAPAATAGVELGAGETAGGRSFISSRRSPLWVLPLCE
jgi:hypothetical protein